MLCCVFCFVQKFVREILEPSYREIGKITKLPRDYEAIKQHTLIVTWSCYYGVLDCEEQTQELFKLWYSEKNPDENNP